MNILYCLLMTGVSVYVVNAMHVLGHETAATALCFVLLAWILLLGRAIDRAVASLPGRIIARSLRTPYTHLPGYMERYWFLRIGRRGGGQSGHYPLIGARVHHILRSDSGRDYHDHPWPFVTIILRGGYWEWRPVLDAAGFIIDEQCRWYGPGSVIVRRAGTWHRLVLPAGQTAWTLFCTGPKSQGWGFLVGNRKVAWREYLGVPPGVGVED